MIDQGKTPEFSMLKPEKDTVLYCQEKKGQSALFKYIPLGSCRLKPGGKTLDEILKDKDERIKFLQGQIDAIVTKLGLTADLAVLTAESRGND